MGAVLALAIVLLIGYESLAGLRPARLPGIFVPHAPSQVPCAVRTWRHGEYNLTALAGLHVKGLVISTERYWFDREAGLSPIDIALGWGPMSDASIIDQISFVHGRRFLLYSPRRGQLALSFDEINSHSANMHLVPATSDVRKMLLGIRDRDILQLQGYLISGEDDEGWRWRSSLSRTDTGYGACERVWGRARKH